MNFKTLLLVVLAHTLALPIFSQQPSCSSLHTGSFKVYTPESGTTYITRTKSEQTEKNDKLGYELILEIKWIDECTYELRPKKLIKGDPVIMGDGKSFMRSKIKQISEKGYMSETTASFTNDVIELWVEIVSK